MNEWSARLNREIKFILHSHHYVIVLILMIVSGGIAYFVCKSADDWRVIVPIFIACGSLVYIIEKQQLDEAVLFKDLFMIFNGRYNELNGELNKLLEKKENLDLVALAKLDDYFNLCAEEYLFYKKGYIDRDVWRNWVWGMKQFYDVAGVRQKWDRELESASYYGFDIQKEIAKLKNGRTSN